MNYRLTPQWIKKLMPLTFPRELIQIRMKTTLMLLKIDVKELPL